MDKFNQLLIIVKKTREAIESSGLYPEDLEGACAVASECIVRYARKEKIRATFVCGYYGNRNQDMDFDYENDICIKENTNHCWVEYQNKIIDVTATQFNIFDMVYIIPKNNTKNYLPIFCGKKGIDFVNKEWPEGQQFKNVKNKLPLTFGTDTL